MGDTAHLLEAKAAGYEGRDSFDPFTPFLFPESLSHSLFPNWLDISSIYGDASRDAGVDWRKWWV